MSAQRIEYIVASPPSRAALPSCPSDLFEQLLGSALVESAPLSGSESLHAPQCAAANETIPGGNALPLQLVPVLERLAAVHGVLQRARRLLAADLVAFESSADGRTVIEAQEGAGGALVLRAFRACLRPALEQVTRDRQVLNWSTLAPVLRDAPAFHLHVQPIAGAAALDTLIVMRRGHGLRFNSREQHHLHCAVQDLARIPGTPLETLSE